MKVNLIHGVVAGVLSAIAGVVYLVMYESVTLIDFSSIVTSINVAASSFIGCMLMALGYITLDKLKVSKFKGVLNIVVMLLSFLSILGPISMALPLDFDFPEMFPGLVIPMHFFPAMIFFGLIPFFESRKTNVQS